MRTSFRLPFACAVALLSGPLPAAAEPGSNGLDIEVELTAVSDYRFRGLSLSDGDPALQGGVTASLAGGAYAYVWTSSIDEYGAGADGAGATVEVDVALGWAGVLGGLDVDASVQAYNYPGGSHVNYIEIPVSASRRTGNIRWSLGAAYAPSQRALGHADNAYGWGAVAWEAEDAPFRTELRAGYEDGAYAPGGKWDWSAGVSRAFGGVTAGLAYVDSDASSAGLIATLTATF